MSSKSGETMDLLYSAYEALTKAGKDSLSKAYTFGGVVNALHDLGFSYKQLADEIQVTVSTVSKYAKLFRKYPTERALTDAAEELETYDVGKLAGDDAPAPPMRFVPHCNSCGSYNVTKERKPADEAEAIREAVEAAQAIVPQARFASA